MVWKRFKNGKVIKFLKQMQQGQSDQGFERDEKKAKWWSFWNRWKKGKVMNFLKVMKNSQSDETFESDQKFTKSWIRRLMKSKKGSSWRGP